MSHVVQMTIIHNILVYETLRVERNSVMWHKGSVILNII
jgi:hypothetical protein